MSHLVHGNTPYGLSYDTQKDHRKSFRYWSIDLPVQAAFFEELVDSDEVEENLTISVYPAFSLRL